MIGATIIERLIKLFLLTKLIEICENITTKIPNKKILILKNL